MRCLLYLEGRGQVIDLDPFAPGGVEISDYQQRAALSGALADRIPLGAKRVPT